ncbi:MAG: RNA polymerase sigma factor [Planctomycetota bacterium]
MNDPLNETEDVAADHDLVMRYLAGDGGAATQIVARLQHLPRIAACLNRRFGRLLDASEVEDLAQASCVIALRKLPKFVQGVPLGAWLYRICNLELRNALRRKRRSATRSIDDTIEDGAQDALASVERREMIFAALEQVKSSDAQAVRMRYLDGLTFVEIGIRLGVSTNTIRGRFYRGMKSLEEVMRMSEVHHGREERA